MSSRQIKQEIFYENEVRTNRRASISLEIMGILLLALNVLDVLAIYDLGGEICRRGMFFAAVLSCSVLPIAWKFKFKAKWIKKAIIASVLVSSSVCFFLYPLNADFLSYGAIIISAMYYDRKLIRRTGVISCILYGALLQANIILEKTSPEINAFHAYQEIGIFKFPMEVLTYHFIPHVVFFFVIAFVCDGIAKRGREFVREQAENTEAISVMESDLNAASEMQLSSLPENDFATDGGNVGVTAFMRPAKAVGGDFYDYFVNGDDLIFLVADVSDKGLPAALFMMKAKNAIRAAFLTGESFEKAVRIANDLLCSDNKENMFITLWIASLNIHTGVGMYANCGHLPPLILHEDGSVEYVENEPNLMMGVFKDAEISVHPLRLKAKDTIVVFTDGLTDAINAEGECFGDERLEAAVAKLSAYEFDGNDFLIQEVDRFVGETEQFDDMTSLRVHMAETLDPVVRTLDLKTGAEYTEQVIDRVNGLLAHTSCPTDVRRNIDVAIDDVCENIREYAYDGNEGDFSVDISVGENYIDLTFTDEGMEFNPLEEDEGPLDGEPSIGGLGIYLYKSIMDAVTYSRTVNKNQLRLTKIWKV